MTKSYISGTLQEAIAAIMNPGREYTRNDIMNRLSSAGVQAQENEVKGAMMPMVQCGIVLADEYSSGKGTTMIYSLAEGAGA